MNIREKLVEIVEKASERTLPKNTCHTNIVMLVNALIEEGVTVQEWISVKDRLPEMTVDVLLYFPIEKNMAVGFLCDVDEDRTMWCAYTDDGFYTSCDYEPTHWMPLPQPPKEERKEE